MDTKFFKVLFYLTLGLNIFLIITYLKYPIIGEDSGFYLSNAREFYNGKIYFQEIGISYNPLSIITFGIPFLFAENPDYSWHLFINIIIVVSSSIFFYKITKLISLNKTYSLFFTSLFILLSLVLDGKYVMLEPVSVFFQLGALYYYLEFLKQADLKKIFLVGLFISFAFLSKQYGVFIALPIGLDILFRKNIKFLNIITLTIGFLIPLSLFYSYLFFNGTNMLEFIKDITGKGMVLDIGNGTGIGTNFFTYPLDFIYLIIFNLYVFIIPIIFIKLYKQLDTKISLFVTIAITSLSVLFFANYWHYYQYIIPYWLLLFAFIFQKIVKKRNKFLIFLVFTISIIFIGLYSIVSFNGKIKAIDSQRKITNTITKLIPSKSEVYLDGLSPLYYYTCDFRSINLKKIGYTFPGYFFPKTILNNLKPNAFLLVSKKRLNSYKNIINNHTLTKIIIEDKEYFIIKTQK